jgi:hypothetical protein
MGFPRALTITTTGGNKMRMRSVVAALGSGALVIMMVACGESGQTTTTTTQVTSVVSSHSPSGQPSLNFALPKFAVGRQLGWVLSAAPHAPLPASEIEKHFDQAFLAKVSVAEINQAFEEFPSTTPWRLISLDAGTTRNELIAGAVAGTAQLSVGIETDSQGLISAAGLDLTPSLQPGPASWQALDTAALGLAPDVGFEAATVGAGGTCDPVNTVAPSTARPLGSMFKLYVLGALADAVAARRLSWDQTVALSASLRSEPSGSLQIEPAGTRYTVAQLADLMISSSDNTAADELAALVGRSAVQAQNRLTSAHASMNVPFLRTRELFMLKYDDYPYYADAYLALSPSARLSYLRTVIDRIPLSAINLTTASLAAPRDIDSLEWFASPADLCAQFARLYRDAGRPGLTPVSTALSFNNGDIALPSSQWPLVWFKGGSETGVLTLGYLARSATGQVVVVVLELSDPSNAISDSTELSALSLAHAAFGLVG